MTRISNQNRNDATHKIEIPLRSQTTQTQTQAHWRFQLIYSLKLKKIII